MFFRAVRGAPRPSEVPPEMWPGELQRLRDRIAMVSAASTALLWLDNLSEHYRGGFRRRIMYVPIAFSPLATVAGLVTATSGGRRGGRTFAVLSAAQVVIALIGFIEHQRALCRKPGADRPRGYLFHAWYGPPVAAPLQYLSLGLMGLMSTVPHRVAAPLLTRVPADQLMRGFIALNLPPLWAEIGYLHARGSFQSPGQWIPVISLPVASVASAVAAASDSDWARAAARATSGWTVLLGIAGTAFHLYGLHRRYGGYDRRSFLFNWLNGPPAPAPLQMVGLGLAGLAAERTRCAS